MKKNIIALAIASAIAAPAAMAEAPTVYGQINVNAGFVKDKDIDFNDTVSRIGIKGSEDLGDGLKAIYGLEWQVDVAGNNAAKNFSSRNTFAGLAGGFGTVMIGRHDTPVKMSQPTDLFNDGAADLDNNNMTAGIETAENRAASMMAYVSPSFSGVKIMAATVRDGDNDTAANDIAVTYGSTKEGLYLAAAMYLPETAGAGDVTRLSAQYKADGLTVSAMYSDADMSGTVTALQAAYKMGKFMPKVKVSMTDSDTAGVANTTNVAVGLNYSLGKKTTAYIYTVAADSDNTVGTDATYVGMLHKF
jgi:predicted porin